MKIVNRTVPPALKTLGYDQPQIDGDPARTSTSTTRSKGRPSFEAEHLPVFDCAFKAARRHPLASHWQAHVGMMAAAQPFLSGAISKTVNMPARLDGRGHRRGVHRRLEARPQGPGHLPRRLEAEPAAQHVSSEDGKRRRPRRRRAVPPSRSAAACRTPAARSRHKFNVGGHEGYITVGLFEDGRPGELFITMAKEGRTVGGLMDVFGTAISMAPPVRRAARSPM